MATGFPKAFSVEDSVKPESPKGPFIVPTALGLAVAAELEKIEEEEETTEAINKLRSHKPLARIDWRRI